LKIKKVLTENTQNLSRIEFNVFTSSKRYSGNSVISIIYNLKL